MQVVRYLPRVPARRDVSGLATPRPRTHFAAFLIRMCIATINLPTIAPQSFHLALRNGAEAPLKFPQTVFADDLDLLGEPGCERGHIVFQVPQSERPSALRFNLDWGTTDMQGFHQQHETPLRMDTLGPASTANGQPVAAGPGEMLPARWGRRGDTSCSRAVACPRPCRPLRRARSWPSRASRSGRRTIREAAGSAFRTLGELEGRGARRHPESDARERGALRARRLCPRAR